MPCERFPCGVKTSRWTWFGIRQYDGTSQPKRTAARPSSSTQYAKSTSSKKTGSFRTPRAVTWWMLFGGTIRSGRAMTSTVRMGGPRRIVPRRVVAI